MWSVKSIRTYHVSALVSSSFFSGCIIHHHAGVSIYLCSFLNGTLFRLFKFWVDITTMVWWTVFCAHVYVFLQNRTLEVKLLSEEGCAFKIFWTWSTDTPNAGTNIPTHQKGMAVSWSLHGHNIYIWAYDVWTLPNFSHMVNYNKLCIIFRISTDNLPGTSGSSIPL